MTKAISTEKGTVNGHRSELALISKHGSSSVSNRAEKVLLQQGATD